MILILTLAAGLMGRAVPAWGCPNCGRGLEEHGLALGYSLSILAMASLPLLLVVAWVAAVIWIARTGAG